MLFEPVRETIDTVFSHPNSMTYFEAAAQTLGIRPTDQDKINTIDTLAKQAFRAHKDSTTCPCSECTRYRCKQSADAIIMTWTD